MLVPEDQRAKVVAELFERPGGDRHAERPRFIALTWRFKSRTSRASVRSLRSLRWAREPFTYARWVCGSAAPVPSAKFLAAGCRAISRRVRAGRPPSCDRARAPN